MKPHSLFTISMICLLSTACIMETPKKDLERWKQEILDTEQAFNDFLKEEGMQAAFLKFAADDAVLMRNDALVKGKQAISERFKNQSSQNPDISLTWKPDFVDVAQSGDLAYTYGQYVFSSIDSTGTKSESKGIFHTVWKRQADGSWKYVWD